MAILSVDDVGILFADLGLSEEQTAAALARAQAIAESSIGAGRPLERKRVTQTTRINHALQTCQLAIHPIDFEEEITVRVRSGNVRNRYRRPVALSNWYELQPGNYSIDPFGQLNLNVRESSNFGLIGQMTTEVEVSYVAGFDFSQVELPEIVLIQGAVVSILSFQERSTSVKTGVKSFEVEAEYKIEFSEGTSSVGVGTALNRTEIPDSLLLPLRQYRPRGLNQSFLRFEPVE